MEYPTQTWQWRRVDDASVTLPDLTRTLNLRMPQLGQLAAQLAEIQGGGPVLAVTAAYTVTAADHTLLCDATAAAFTVTLPAAATVSGRRYVIKKVDGSANDVTVDGAGAETIDGAGTYALTAQWQSITVQSDGTDWYVLTWTSTGGGGGGGNYFGVIAVSGQSDVIADADPDTLTLAAGANIAITTDAGADTVTIAATGLAATSHTHVAADVTDFATAVAATAPVTANTAKVTNATHTGDVTGSGALTIAAGAVTLAKMANLAASSIIGNNTGAPATPIALTAAQVKTLLAIASTDVSGLGTLATQSGTFSGTSSGTNTGDNAVNTLYSGLVTNATHTGDVTGSGALTIAAGAVTLAKMADMATDSFLGRDTAGTGAPEVLSVATVKTLLNLAGTNTGDQTSVTGNAGTATALATGRTISISGDLTYTSPSFDGTGNVTAAGTIAADAVTYAKMQNVSAASRLLGRGSAGGAGDVEELTVGSGLTITGTVLSATGGGGSGDVAGPASATDNAVVLFDGTTGKLVKNSVVIAVAGAVSGVTTLTTSGAINGQTISAAANFTGTVTIAGTLTHNAGTANIAQNTTTSILNVGSGAGSSSTLVDMRRIAGQEGSYQFSTGTSRRWRLILTSDAESGSNVGSDLVVQRYDDTGTSLGSLLRFTRSTGVSTFNANVVVAAGGITVTGNSTITGTLGGITTLTATTFVGALTGNASTATTAAALTTGRTISITGDLAYTSPAFDGSGNVTAAGTIAAGAVTLAKMANLAQDTAIGRVTASTGVPETFTVTAAGRALLDDVDASAQRTTLGLGTLATQSGTFSGTSSGTNTGDNAVNTLYSGLVTNATHTGDVTGATALTIAAGAVTLAKMADMATDSFLGRDTAGTGAPEVLSVATVKTLLNLAGTNTGDQTSVTGNAGTATALATGRTIAITGDLSYTSPSFDGTSNVTAAGTIAAGAVTLAKMANIATDRLIGRDTAATGVPEALTVGGGIEFTGAGGIQTSAFTGDVTKTAGGTALTIANDAVTYAKMQNAAAGNVALARAAATSGDYSEVALAASRLLGRGSSGDIAAMSLGTGLAFSGTEIRPAGRIFDPIVNYSAVADGTTDDTTPIQNAINAANSAGGGVVMLQSGKAFGISSLTLYSNVVLLGYGAILRRVANAGNAMLVNSASATDFGVHGVKIDGQRANATYQITNARAVFFASATRVKVRDCYVYAQYGDGIRIDASCLDADVSHNTVVDSGIEPAHGIMFRSVTSDSTNSADDPVTTYRFVCNNNTIDSIGGSGIMLFCVGQGTVSGNTIRSSGQRGINIGPTSVDLTITANTVMLSGSTGIHGANRSKRIVVTGNTVTGTTTEASGNGDEGQGIKFYVGCAELTITGNTCTLNCTDGIAVLAAVERVTITGNTCHANGSGTTNRADSSAGDGIRVQAGDGYGGALTGGDCANITITGNTCTANAGSGIYCHSTNTVDLADYLTVTGNVCNSNSLYGLRFDEYCRYGVVTDNACYNNVTGAISNLSSYLSVRHNAVNATTDPTGEGTGHTFGTIAVSGQSDVVADAFGDTLTLVAGANITITTTPGSDSVTITGSGGGSGLTQPQVMARSMGC